MADESIPNGEALSSKLEMVQCLKRTLCFFSKPENGEEPKYVSDDSGSPGVRNYPHHQVDVHIEDIRGREEEFHLSTHSFQAIPGVSLKPVDFDNPESIRHIYFPMVERLILDNVPGSKTVSIFDFTIRQASKTKVANRQVNKIHIDQSPQGAFLRAARHLSTTEVSAVNSGKCRFRIINVWKPIVGPVLDHPLTFADYRSVRQDDLVPVKQVYPDYIGETYVLKHHKGQVFWYWSNMTPKEVLLLQCFDSDVQVGENGTMRHAQCAHGSFEMDQSGNEPFNRCSIEVRCIVLG